jgi:putative endonuclease
MEGIGVYILLCSNNRYYIGSTKDINRRLSEHHSGRVNSTKHILPVKLMLFHQYDNYSLARKIEIKLKSYKNKTIIDKIIIDGKILSAG